MPPLVTALAVFFLHGPSAPAEVPSPSAGPRITLSADVAKRVLLADETQLTHLKVGLRGFKPSDEKPRPPINLALVLDRSSSMTGEKIQQAREAAQLAVRSLRDDDIVSLVTFDSGIDVPIPATRATDRERLCQLISAIQPRGNTALFGGMAKGAAEVRKFLSRERINRILLLSDGQANIGPNTPGELGELGASLIKEGMSVTTIGLGLGYNEDLMIRLPETSDGGHAFIENASQLAEAFLDELGAASSVIAQRVDLHIQCDPGVRPVRVLGREATITASSVRLALNQLYAGEEKYILLEVEVPAGSSGLARDLARVQVSYDNLDTRERDELSNVSRVRFSSSLAEVEAAVNKDVLVVTVTQLATLNNKEALRLADQGRVEDARRTLLDNVDYLSRHAARLNSQELADYSTLNRLHWKDLGEGKRNEAQKKCRNPPIKIDTIKTSASKRPPNANRLPNEITPDRTTKPPADENSSHHPLHFGNICHLRIGEIGCGCHPTADQIRYH